MRDIAPALAAVSWLTAHSLLGLHVNEEDSEALVHAIFKLPTLQHLLRAAPVRVSAVIGSPRRVRAIPSASALAHAMTSWLRLKGAP